MRTPYFKEKTRLEELQIRNREHTYRKFEVCLIFAATGFSFMALYFSWDSASSSRDQAQSAKASLYFGAETESFINYSRQFRSYCNGFNYGSTVRTDITKGYPALRFTEDAVFANLSDAEVEALSKSQIDKKEVFGQSMDELRLWLPPDQAAEVYESYMKTIAMNYRGAYIGTKYPNSLAFDAARVACYATQQSLMEWYRDRSNDTKLKISDRANVFLDLGGGKEEVDILTAWGMRDALKLNEKYRKLPVSTDE